MVDQSPYGKIDSCTPESFSGHLHCTLYKKANQNIKGHGTGVAHFKSE